MCWQPNCAIADPEAARYGLAISVVRAKLPLRGQEAGRDLERWSG
jgi:hypothetical protein